MPGWEALPSTPERAVRLRICLHQLIFYLSMGFTGFAQIPFGQNRGIMHLGECQGCCCCPWHFQAGGKSENMHRAVQYRRFRCEGGKINYADPPLGYVAPAGG